MANGVDHSVHDLVSLLSSGERDFLVRNNGNEVKISDLVGKKVGLYFSASWCGPCRRFTPDFVEAYEELLSKGDFEVIFVSSDRVDEAFVAYFAKMPWLAIPFSDSETRKRLGALFKVRGIPCLVILDGSGEVLSDQGVKIIKDYGSEGYPFTPERVKILREEQEAAAKEQSLRSILVFKSRDFVISKTGMKIPVSELEGKMVGLYFSMTLNKGCLEFTTKLVQFYNKIKGLGHNFEIVLISLDDEEEPFKQGFETMPWLALPFKDKSCEKLARYFNVATLPTLVVVSPDGKTLNRNVVELIEEHGADAYPFTPQKLLELAEIEKARKEAQTLESILVSGDRDFVIGNSGSKVTVSELVGKTILLYFSAQWCPPCRDFLPKFIELYDEIKAKDEAFEVIFISSDRDQFSFDDFFASMPWLALPFGDERKAFLHQRFKVRGIPAVVAIGPSGKTLTTQARQLLQAHGADAYPFTEEHLEKLDEMKRAPKTDTKEGENAKEGWTCEGGVCRKT